MTVVGFRRYEVVVQVEAPSLPAFDQAVKWIPVWLRLGVPKTLHGCPVLSVDVQTTSAGAEDTAA